MEAHIGAMAQWRNNSNMTSILVILLLWFGYIARPSQWGGRGLFTSSNDFYLPLRRLKEGVGVSTPFRIQIVPVQFVLGKFFGLRYYKEKDTNLVASISKI